jgi:DNA-binding response OmpR family regulator
VTAPRILVVDDEKDILNVFKKGLEQAGFLVDGEVDPIRAFVNFKPNTYDLVILDLKMPDISGVELYRKLRQIDSKFKICFVSAFVRTREIIEANYPELKESTCILEKPITIAKLVEIINSQLNSAR